MSGNVYHDFFDVRMNFRKRAVFSQQWILQGNEQAVIRRGWSNEQDTKCCKTICWELAMSIERVLRSRVELHSYSQENVCGFLSNSRSYKLSSFLHVLVSVEANCFRVQIDK